LRERLQGGIIIKRGAATEQEREQEQEAATAHRHSHVAMRVRNHTNRVAG